MLNRKLIAICCETHTQHRNTLCGQEKKIFNIKYGGT